MSEIRKNLGGVTAYAYAKTKGYTGTEEEFAQLMANYATISETATEAAERATTKASEASTSATNAATSASAASASATAAAGSASAAATSETNAAASATSASGSATQAATSATAAQAAQAAAEEVAESIPEDYSELSADVDDLKNALNATQNYVDAERWNLLDLNMFYDGAILDTNGDINPNFSNWSYTDYIEVEPDTIYSQYSTDGNVDISGGVYVSQYDASKNFISIKGGNKMQITTTATTKYVRLSTQTIYKSKLLFGAQELRLQTPTHFFDKVSFDRNQVKWKTGYVILTGGSGIEKLELNTWQTTEYVFLRKGNYFVSPVSNGGMYITVFDNNLQTVSNAPTSSNKYGQISLTDDAFVTVSIMTSQSVTLMTEAEYNLLVTKDVVDEKIVNVIKNKKICFFGDSITCLGNDFRNASWQGMLKNYFGFTNAFSVGIGGTHLRWSESETYDFSSHTLGNNLPYGATKTTGGTGDVASFCSWNRIVKTVPSDCDIVFIMGGTNDADTQVSGSTEMSASNTTDSAWVSSDSYIGGDYDITSINGGILSIIMKMHIHCPDALIILCTPMSGRGDTGGQNQLNYSSGDYTHSIAEAIKEMSNLMSTECFDLFGSCGITPYNRATYLYDTVHPNANGMKMIGRYLIEKFKGVYPRIA